LFSATAFAQQTGSISGRVTATDGSALPGVTVEARSPVLPQPRVTTTDSNGDYRLPALQPGSYVVTYTLAGMQTASRKADVQLGENVTADVKLGVAGLSETVTVTAEASMVDKQSTAIQTALSNEQIRALPVGQDYRELQKLIPGVMYTQDGTRGPSAGGSGQDNVYQFDGVKVTLPQYGTLAADPSSHDIAQVNIVKGGSKAVDFDRSGGFTIDSVSKSGTNRFSGAASYQIQNKNFNAKPAIVSSSKFDENRSWLDFNLGGPIVPDRLFFYGSYFRPERSRSNRSNAYGDLPAYNFTRKEEFGKLTFTPISSILLNASYRDSNRLEKSNLFGGFQSPTTGSGNENRLKIGIAEGSWVLNSKSYATFKFNDFKNYTASRPDIAVSGVTVSNAPGTKLDIANLDKIGLVNVPCPTNRPAGAPCGISFSTAPNNAINTFITPYINKYGYLGANNERIGGGQVGVGPQFDKDDFFRRQGQVGYNLTLGSRVTHDLHAGYQRFNDSENLLRSSNGWGTITVNGGNANCPAATCGTAQPIFFTAVVSQQSAANIPPIHSEYRSQNVEFNDSIRMANWTFNAGVIVSNDTLYGSGLAPANNVAGLVKSIGTRYKMYNVPWAKMIQPRLGATWAYNGQDTVYGSYNIYNPAVSSLPRAASFDRGNNATINVFFDANGNVIGSQAIRSSNGKLFVPNLKPKTVNEMLIGTAQQINNQWSARAYGRYRKATHFWEDTPNNSRVNCGIEAVTGGVFDPNVCKPPASVPRTPYIADLTARIGAIGTPGATYVIADLNGAFTKYYEATFESDWRGSKTALHGSYTWSHYYGNFDQDNTTVDNDLNIFYGSSNIADGPGRQIWDNKYGNLRGDRRHMLKAFGTYSLPWKAVLGAFGVYQSGQPWEAWNYEIYKPLTGTSTSDTVRFAEPAGSRRTPSHHQVDLKYTQSFGVFRGTNLQMIVDWYNLYNKRTPYSFQPSVHSAAFGQPRLAMDPRKFQLSLRLDF
jgi:hypothetical protein